jgi:hypothetical protein
MVIAKNQLPEIDKIVYLQIEKKKFRKIQMISKIF